MILLTRFSATGISGSPLLPPLLQEQAELHRTIELTCTRGKDAIQRSSKAISILAVATFLVGAAAAENHKHCQVVGGMLMTNLGAIDADTTMGTVTGGFESAVGATILSTEASGNTLVLHVQHHRVTESEYYPQS